MRLVSHGHIVLETGVGKSGSGAKPGSKTEIRMSCCGSIRRARARARARSDEDVAMRWVRLFPACTDGAVDPGRCRDKEVLLHWRSGLELAPFQIGVVNDEAR